MKLVPDTVYLPDSFWLLLDAFARAEGFESRSLAIEHLIGRLIGR